jgi:hypothetical protein
VLACRLFASVGWRCHSALTSYGWSSEGSNAAMQFGMRKAAYVVVLDIRTPNGISSTTEVMTGIGQILRNDLGCLARFGAGY